MNNYWRSNTVSIAGNILPPPQILPLYPDDPKISIGAIIGIVAGSIIGLIIIVLLVKKYAASKIISSSNDEAINNSIYSMDRY